MSLFKKKPKKVVTTYRQFQDCVNGAQSRIYLIIAKEHSDFWARSEVQSELEKLASKECDVKILTDSMDLLPVALLDSDVVVDNSYTQGTKATPCVFDNDLMLLSLGEQKYSKNPAYLHMKKVKEWAMAYSLNFK